VPERSGGIEGNARLTATTAVVLIVLLAIEGVTILFIRPLLSLHMFVGVMLIPPVALKLASTSWRFFRYYAGSATYRQKGPPPLLLRLLVAPAVILSTLFLFGTGVALLAIGPGDGIVVGLHKTSFVVWLVAVGVHVLAHIRALPRDASNDWRRATRFPAAAVRFGLVAAALFVGAGAAAATLHLAHPWQHRGGGERGEDDSR
jgi:hypothetical protein